MCNLLCTTSTLAEHLSPCTELDEPLATPLRCRDCQLPCPTECALMAHMALHIPDLPPYPYACPECGLKVLGSQLQAEKHAVAVCLHLTRDIKISCSICRVEVVDAKAHMIQGHVQKLYKCRKCPLAFESINGFDGHLSDKHPGEPATVGGEAYMLILKCPFCAATFNNPQALTMHMTSKRHGESTLQLQTAVFRCPAVECTTAYALKAELRQHLDSVHPRLDLSKTRMSHPPVPGSRGPAGQV